MNELIQPVFSSSQVGSNTTTPQYYKVYVYIYEYFQPNSFIQGSSKIEAARVLYHSKLKRVGAVNQEELADLTTTRQPARPGPTFSVARLPMDPGDQAGPLWEMFAKCVNLREGDECR